MAGNEKIGPRWFAGPQSPLGSTSDKVNLVVKSKFTCPMTSISQKHNAIQNCINLTVLLWLISGHAKSIISGSLESPYWLLLAFCPKIW